MNRLTAFLLLIVGAFAFGAAAKAQVAKAEFVEVKFALRIDDKLLGEPSVVLKVGQKATISAAEGRNPYRLDIEVADTFVDEKGRPLATANVGVFEGGPAGWVLVAEPQVVVLLGAAAASVELSPGESARAVSVDLAATAVSRVELEKRLGGSAMLNSCSEPSLKSEVAKSCCGGYCSDGRRWQCCNAVQCCNLCPGAGCCQPP